MTRKPQFVVRKIEANPRVEGDFRVEATPGIEPSVAAKAYVDTLDGVIAKIAEAERQSLDDDSADGMEVSAITLDRQYSRSAALERIARIAHEFCRLSDTGDSAAHYARDETLRAHGGFVRDFERITEALYSVSFTYDRRGSAPNGTVVDITILIVNIGGSPPLKKPTSEQKQLYSSIDETRAVIKEVAAQLRAGSAGWLGCLSRRGPSDAWDRRADRLQHDYLVRLGAIARIGLQLGHSEMAAAALASLREEFIMEQTGRIKNEHIFRLGTASAAAIMVALLISYLVATFEVPNSRVHLVAAAVIGASIGAWLSFAVRRVSLSFRELAIIEDDFIRPGARITIVSLLTIVVCLMLELKLVSVKLGELDTTNLRSDAALLIGFLCGLAERVIASSVVAQANAFAGGMGRKS